VRQRRIERTETTGNLILGSRKKQIGDQIGVGDRVGKTKRLATNRSFDEFGREIEVNGLSMIGKGEKINQRVRK
jgi:hypothetical protein